MWEPTADIDFVAREIVDCAFTVHTSLGPGLLESVYETCLAHELETRGIPVLRQVNLPVIYRSIRVDGGFRIDMLVGECVLVEIKSVERILPVHEAQVLTYLKLSQHQIGLLINFNVSLIKHGIRRLINPS